MKHKRYLVGLMAVVLIVAIFSATGFSLLPASAEVMPKGQEREISYIGNHKYDDLTNNREIDGYDIEKYPEQYFGSNAILDYDLITPRADDLITKFVPKELFTYVNQTMHVGREYGFLVDCHEGATYEIKPSGRKPLLYTTVMLFLINTGDDLEESFSHLQIEVKPIFQGMFVQLKSDFRDALKFETIPINSTVFEPEVSGYRIEADPMFIKNDMIVPVPTSKNVYGDKYTREYKQYHKYFLTDMQAATSLYNANHLNPGDEGYQIEDDYGAFISQIDYEYSGKFIENGKNKVEDTWRASMDTVMAGADIVNTILNNTAKSIPILSSIYSVYSVMLDLVSLGKSKIETVQSEHKLTYKAFYNSRDMQIREGYFNRSALIAVQPVEAKALYFGVGDRAMFDYQINHPDYNWDTYYETMIHLKAVPIDQKGKIGDAIEGSGIFDGKLNHREYDYYEKKDIHTQEDLAEESVFIFQKRASIRAFTPTKTGRYVLNVGGRNGLNLDLYQKAEIFSEQKPGIHIAGSHSSTTGRQIEAELKAGQTYYIRMSLDGFYDADGFWADRFGLIDLTITFEPEFVELGQTAVLEADGLDRIYRRFAAEESGVYRFILDGNAGQAMVRVSAYGSLSYLVIDDSAQFEVFLQAGMVYEIMLFNNRTAFTSLPLVIEPSKEINITDSFSENITKHTFYQAIAPVNGLYTFSAAADCRLGLAVYDGNFNLLGTGQNGTSDRVTLFLQQGQAYYYQVTLYAAGTQTVRVGFDFDPPVVNGGNRLVDNSRGYDYVAFVPDISGEFVFSTRDTQDKKDVSANITVQNADFSAKSGTSFVAGVRYLIKVDSGTKGQVLLKIRLSANELEHNRPYRAGKGANMATFVAPLSGEYKLLGADEYVIYKLDYTVVMSSGSTPRALDAGETYIVEFQCKNAVDVRMVFSPTEVNQTANVVINANSYFTIEVDKADEFTIMAKPFYGSATIKLFDADLRELFSGKDSMIETLQAGRYYLLVEAMRIDTLLSVKSKNAVTTGYIPYQNKKINQSINGNSPTIRYTYDQKASKTRFYLRINEVLGENINVAGYYYENGNMQELEIVKTGQAGLYYCDLERSKGYYDFIVFSDIQKQLEFELYVPASIQRVEIDGVDIYSMPNSLFVTLGTTHKFNVICNDNATNSDFTMSLVGKSIKGVTITGKQLKIADDASLLGKDGFIEILFETADGNDYRTYLFEIKNPHTASAELLGTSLQLTYKDLYGNISSGAKVKKVAYYAETAGNAFLVSEENDISAGYDFIHLNNIVKVHVYAVVTYQNGFVEQLKAIEMADHVFDLITYTHKNPRVLINAENKKNGGVVLTIAESVTTLNIFGNSGVLYDDVRIVIEKRKTPLTINLQNFRFTTNGAVIDAKEADEVIINFNGNNAMTSKSPMSNVIDANSIILNGGSTWDMEMKPTTANGVLTIEAATVALSTSTSGKTAGAGISAKSVLIQGATITISGGNGTYQSLSSAYTGVHGGSGIVASTVVISNSSATIKGGSGSAGSNGKNGTQGSEGKHNTSSSAGTGAGGTGNAGETGGTGGKGGYAIKADSLDVVKSTLLATGGNGGTGGAGGTGGQGGTGGTDKYRPGSGVAYAGGTGGTGGKGGVGGAGGRGGEALYVGKLTVCTASGGKLTGGNGGNSGNGGKGGVGGTGGKGGHGNHRTFQMGNQTKAAAGGKGGTGGQGAYAGTVGTGAPAVSTVAAPAALTCMAGTNGKAGTNGVGGIGGKGGDAGWHTDNTGASGGAGGAGGYDATGKTRADTGSAGAKSVKIDKKLAGTKDYPCYSTGCDH